MKSISNCSVKIRRKRRSSQEPDFGTYHHSTPQASQKIREQVKMLFTKVFSSLPYVCDNSLKIVDIGCGLGFLSCICAEYYPNARIIGFDTFKHASLKESSLARANKNAKILGFSNRILFEKGNVFSSNYRKGKYDLFVSNLVFHNLGIKRINAYEILARWMTPKSYLILSDLFFDYKTDFKWLTGHFSNIEKINCFNMGRQYKMLVLSHPNK